MEKINPENLNRGDDEQADYRVSLIVVVKTAEDEYGLCDELIYVQSLEEAKAKQAEIQKRQGQYKRRIIILVSASESKNFSPYK